MPIAHRHNLSSRISVPAALSLVLASSAAFSEVMDEFWSASEGKGWTNSFGECWNSQGGPTDVAPCAAEIIEGFTIDLDNDEFAFDKAVLTPDMERALDDLAQGVKESPGDEKLTIVGHTDGVGSQDYNVALGQRRADATRDYLVAKGGIDGSRIETMSQGKSQPVATNETDEGRGKNRRVEVRAELYVAGG